MSSKSLSALQGNIMYLIEPSHDEISQGLESWDWLPIEGKVPFSVTAFGDVFMESPEGIWFLDTIEGSVNKVAENKEELQEILNTEEGQDHYLMSGFVENAVNEGMVLKKGQCFDFKVNPILGGPIEFENIEIQNFVVSLNVSGQIHGQVKDLPHGTKLNEIEISQ